VRDAYHRIIVDVIARRRPRRCSRVSVDPTLAAGIEAFRLGHRMHAPVAVVAGRAARAAVSGDHPGGAEG
jgi:hypothetical protein